MLPAAALALAVALPPLPATHVLEGELARVDLAGGAVVVKEDGPPPRERRVRVAEDTIVSARGRTLALAGLRPGERIMILCVDAAHGVHRAQRIKLGTSRQGAKGNGTR